MKKGFTLIELLGVLVIISLVSLIVTPKVSELFHKKQLEASAAFKEEIFLATRHYITNNAHDFNTGANFYCVTVNDLLDKGELVDPVIDVTTGNNIDYETNIEVTIDEYNNYQLTYNTERCKQKDLTVPIISIQKIITVDKSKVTLIINANDNVGLDPIPYSFDNGSSWQASNQKDITDAFNETIKVKDSSGNIASVDYSISKLTIDANGGIWNSLSTNTFYWLEKNDTMTIVNPIRIGYSFSSWSGATLNELVFKMNESNVTITANWVDVLPPTCTYVKSNTYSATGVTITYNCSDNGSGLFTPATGTYTNVTSNQNITSTDNSGNTSSITVPILTATQYAYRDCTKCGNTEGYGSWGGPQYSCATGGNSTVSMADSVCQWNSGCSWVSASSSTCGYKAMYVCTGIYTRGCYTTNCATSTYCGRLDDGWSTWTTSATTVTESRTSSLWRQVQNITVYY